MIEWRPYPPFPDCYEISDDGQVRSLSRHGKIGKVLKQWTTKQGYLRVSMWIHGERHQTTVHAAVLTTFISARPSGMVACHRNGVRTDNKLSNLRWDTMLNNHLEKKVHNTFQTGENHGMAKLTWNAVHFIRTSAETGRALAKQFGVSETTISQIRKRQTWRTRQSTARAEMQLK